MSDEEKKIEETPVEDTTTPTTEETVDAPKTEEVPEVKEQETKNEEVKDEVKDEIPQEEKKDEPIVIDNAAEAPVQPIQELPRTAKLKEPMSKKKKITIIAIAVVAFIALFSVVFFPVYFCYIQGRIHIYDASDFVPEDGKRFVLEKDIVVETDLDLSASTCSIDLNGHNLTVKGTLTLGTNNATINVGTLKKGEYTATGLLTAGTLKVDAPASTININSALIVNDTIDMVAKEITLNNLSANVAATLSANSLTVKGPFTATNDATTLTIKDCLSASFNDAVDVKNVTVTNSNITLSNQGSLKNVNLDETSTLVANGSIESVTGGLKVAMLKGHTCPSYTNVNVLAIYNAFEKTYSATNCAKIVYLETLPTPVDFVVSEEGGEFNAICAKVDKFDGVTYKFLSDSEVLPTVDAHLNFVNITKYLKENGAATHKLEAYALGNFDFTTLETQVLLDGQTLYLDCEVPATLDYTYTLKLSTPKNVQMKNDDGKIYITLDEVEFADYYVVTVDGSTKVLVAKDTKEAFEQAYPSIAAQYGQNYVQYQSLFGTIGADMTSYVEQLGYHALRIVASSTVKEIETSKEAMTSYKTEKKIQLQKDGISATSTLNNDGTYTNTITISNAENGKVFALTINGKTVRISNTNTYTFTTETSMAGEEVTVVAEAYGYYLESDPEIITFIVG